MEITYELIKPLIVKEEDGEHNMIKLAFKTEEMVAPLETVAVMVPDQDELMKNAMKMAGMSAAAGAAVSGIAGMAGSALGSLGSQAVNMAGSAVTSNMMDPSKLMQGSSGDAARQKAIVTAFMGLAQFFEYDEDQKKWKHKG